MDVFTRLWGTDPSYETRHIVRKIPMRVEPKSYYCTRIVPSTALRCLSVVANERTFLSWLKMAVALGGVSSAVFGYKKSKEEDTEDEERLISATTIDMIYTCLLPLSMIMILYALTICLRRRSCLKTKTVTVFFNDRIGPTCIAVTVVGVLLAIYGSALRDFSGHI